MHDLFTTGRLPLVGTWFPHERHPLRPILASLLVTRRIPLGPSPPHFGLPSGWNCKSEIAAAIIVRASISDWKPSHILVNDCISPDAGSLCRSLSYLRTPPQ